MIEIVIERSTNAEGEATFQWKVFDNDQEIETGRNTHFSADHCEESAVEFCWSQLGYKPDKVTRH